MRFDAPRFRGPARRSACSSTFWFYTACSAGPSSRHRMTCVYACCNSHSACHPVSPHLFLLSRTHAFYHELILGRHRGKLQPQDTLHPYHTYGPLNMARPARCESFMPTNIWRWPQAVVFFLVPAIAGAAEGAAVGGRGGEIRRK